VILAQEALALSRFVARISSPESAQLADPRHMGQDGVPLAQRPAAGSIAIRAVVCHDAAITAAHVGDDSAQQTQSAMGDGAESD
jgi:hypothetical protein